MSLVDWSQRRETVEDVTRQIKVGGGRYVVDGTRVGVGRRAVVACPAIKQCTTSHGCVNVWMIYRSIYQLLFTQQCEITLLVVAQCAVHREATNSAIHVVLTCPIVPHTDSNTQLDKRALCAAAVSIALGRLTRVAASNIQTKQIKANSPSYSGCP
jgi:hypothetical protein